MNTKVDFILKQKMIYFKARKSFKKTIRFLLKLQVWFMIIKFHILNNQHFILFTISLPFLR